MTKTEEQVLRNVIARLRCEPDAKGRVRESEEVMEALRGPARVYLESWVIPGLEMLLPEHRNPTQAERTTRR